MRGFLGRHYTDISFTLALLAIVGLGYFTLLHGYNEPRCTLTTEASSMHLAAPAPEPVAVP